MVAHNNGTGDLTYTTVYVYTGGINNVHMLVTLLYQIPCTSHSFLMLCNCTRTTPI